MRSVDMSRALAAIKAHRDRLTAQQYKTLKGQALHGDYDGAAKGMLKIMKGGETADFCKEGPEVLDIDGVVGEASAGQSGDHR